MTATLPLFSDLAESVRAQSAANQGVDSVLAGSALAEETDDGQQHLHAAWRLSRTMRRFRAGSVEETRVGLAICHHLQALLRQASAAQASGSHRSDESIPV